MRFFAELNRPNHSLRMRYTDDHILRRNAGPANEVDSQTFSDAGVRGPAVHKNIPFQNYQMNQLDLAVVVRWQLSLSASHTAQ